ncbi:MAG: serine/threonine-protein kinase [Candidatus Nitrospinota bacterium M3_3B_026]
MSWKLGRYEIIKELGRGGMGIVLKGKDPRIDRLVALKIIRLDDIGDTAREKELLERFYIEARAAGKLAHPNIITIYDIGEEESKSFLAMEYIEGLDLSAILAETGPMPVERASPIVEQIADGLAFAHERGIVHRDIKPGNILLQDGDRVKITDFGLARLASAGSVTQTGHAVGSPSYMSPEQVQGLPVDGRSDIFSLGVMFYEMVTGRRPFEGESLTSIIYKIIKDQPPPPSSVAPGVPPAVDAIIGKMMAKSPDERYQSGRELVEDIRKLSAGGGFLGLTDSDAVMTVDFDRNDITKELEEPSKPAARRGSTATALFLLFLVMAAGAGYYYYGRLTVEPPAEPWSAAAPEIPEPETPEVKETAVGKAQKPTEPAPATAPEPVGITLKVKSPVKGETYIDGEKAGAAPGEMEASLAPGEHMVEVRAEGYSPWTREVTVKEDGPIEISAKPALAPGTLKVYTRPGGGVIWIDKKKKGAAPLLLAGLSPGEHRLKAAMKGYEDVTRSFRMSETEGATLDIKLKKITTGSLSVVSEPPGAEVFLDGRRLGAAPSTWKAPQGERAIAVKAEGYRPYHGKVTIGAGGQAEVKAVLEKIGRGLITVTATPWADVYFNGEKVGVTPPTLEREVREGQVEVRLINPGFKPFVETYVVEEDKRLKISHTFTEMEAKRAKAGVGALKVISRTPGMVFIDGRLHGKTPLEAGDIPAGAHRLVVKREGRPDYKRKVMIEEGVTSRIEIP